MTAPSVALVGAGPGDPELLTLAAEAALASAEVVVADAEVVALAVAFAPHAEIVAVDGDDPIPGELVDLLAAGPDDQPGGRVRLVRLYLGDPWLHAAFGPERRALVAGGLEVDVVPGVAVELATLADAGIAAHHRPIAVALTIGAVSDLPAAADPARTLIACPADLQAAARLLVSKAGSDERLAAAAITRLQPDGQRVVARADLGDLAAAAPSRPGVIVAGGVAR